MKTLGAVGLIVLPLACCAGLPLLLAFASGAVLALWGAVAFGVVLVAATALFALRALRRRSAPLSSSEVSAHERCC